MVFEVDYNGARVWELESADPLFIINRAQKYGYNYFNSMVGDLNGDDVINVLDIVYLVSLVLDNQYNENADLNEDGTVNILDIVNLISIILNE